MDEKVQEKVIDESGTVKISDEVVAIVAGIATSQVEGVSSMSGGIAGGIAELLSGKKNATKGIKVDIKDGKAVIDIHITVMYGVKIPEVSWDIQEKVKADIESMTGLEVLKVNIHVEGITLEEDEAAEEVVFPEAQED